MKNERRISLLHVASSHGIGLTNQETQLAIAYQSLGVINLMVLTGENEQVQGSFGKLDSYGIPFRRIRGFDVHQDFWRLVRNFSAISKEHDADIVSVNTNWQLLIAGLARTLGRGRYKIIYTIHGFRHNSPIKSAFARVLIGLLLFTFSDAINAPSSYTRKKFPLLRRKLKSIPLGEDDIFFEHAELPDFSKQIRFCFPGQFRKGKNQSLLIQAFAEYVTQSEDNGARLILCGEGELLGDAKSMASSLGIDNQVVFMGQLDREQILEMYKSAQIAVIPTNSETFGHCIAEPLVMNRVVLSRPVGIAIDSLEHGRNGFLFESKAELVELMLKIKAMSVEKLTEIAKQAGETGKQFKWDTIAKKNVTLLMEPLLNDV